MNPINPWTWIPFPYRVLILCAAVVGLFGAGVGTGVHFADQAAEVAEAKRERLAAQAERDQHARDAHAAKEAADLSRGQYLDEERLAAKLQRQIDTHQEPPDAPPAVSPVVVAPSAPAASVCSCPRGLTDERVRFLRGLATAAAGDHPDPAGAPGDVRHAGPHSPALSRPN